jgi:hypothetical protein
MENRIGREFLGNKDIHMKITLEWSIKKQCVMEWIGFTWLRIRINVRFVSTRH